MVWLEGQGVTAALDEDAWKVHLEEWNHLCFTFTQTIFTIYWQGDVGIMSENEVAIFFYTYTQRAYPIYKDKRPFANYAYHQFLLSLLQEFFRARLDFSWVLAMNGTLIVGQEQDTLAGGFDATQVRFPFKFPSVSVGFRRFSFLVFIIHSFTFVSSAALGRPPIPIEYFRFLSISCGYFRIHSFLFVFLWHPSVLSGFLRFL